MAATLCGCSSQSESTGIRNVFLVDVSNEHTEEIAHVFEDGGVGYPEFSWSAHTTRYGVIRNSSYAEITEYSLAYANEYLSNKESRKKELNEYRTQLLSLKHRDSIEYEGSLIWESVINELVYVSEDSTQATTVYVYSDLLEFNEWMSFYLPKYRTMLKNDPDAVALLFKARMKSLKSVHHIKVVIVHEPSIHTEENEFFTLIVEHIYTPLLAEKGIPVSVLSKI
jgi:hypothetical protein